jgi:hypothetical protein
VTRLGNFLSTGRLFLRAVFFSKEEWEIIWLLFQCMIGYLLILPQKGWATLWAILFRTRPVTLAGSYITLGWNLWVLKKSSKSSLENNYRSACVAICNLIGPFYPPS